MNRVCVSLMPPRMCNAGILSSRVDLINTFAEYAVEKCY